MSEKKKCGWCGKEIEDGDYFKVWKKDRLNGIFCKPALSFALLLIALQLVC
jgi:hypothetical protein